MRTWFRFEELILRIYVLVVLLSMFGSTRISAQVVGGDIQGTITDASGAVLPDAQITVENLSTGITRVVPADSDGFYASPNLLPGTYKLTATKPGFGTVSVEITVEIGSQRVIDLVMHVGQVREEVHVLDEAPDVEAASSEISAVVNGTTIRELPLNGRDWTQLATLQPGVASIRTQPDLKSGNKGQRGLGNQMTISGGRPQQNNYRLDGISINDYANAAPGSVLGVDLGADAVQEFSVLTSNYPAEYGRSSGGVINAITRSGTNTFHGDAYEFIRNSALDASNYFDTVKPPFRRNQFGIAVGGPIQKDRTFVFGNYEGLRQSLGVTQIDNVPSPAARSGQLSTGAVTVDPAVIPYLGFYPLPNAGLLPPGDTGLYKFSGQQITNEDYATARVDHTFSTQDSLSGTYMFDNAQTVQPTPLNVILAGFSSRRQLVTLGENHSFSAQTLNNLRLGFNRVLARIGQTPKAVNPLGADPSLGFSPGLPVGEIDVPGLATFGGGLGSPNNYNFHWNSIQAYDDATIIRGVQTFKFGFAFERIQDNMLSAANPNGTFSFNSLSDFLTNIPLTFAADLHPATPRYIRQSVVGTYIGDDVRLFKHFTVNLGLRYEMATVPVEIHGNLANLRNITDPLPHIGNPYFANPTLHNFEPRIGFSWDPWGNGKTAIRAGFGMFDVLPLPYEFEILSTFSAPFLLQGNTSSPPAGSFPNKVFPLIAADPTTLRYAHIQPNPPRNYVMQWNLNVQREVGGKLTIMAGYVGSRGVHQPFRADDVDVVLPIEKTARGYIWPCAQEVNGVCLAGGSGNRINPNIGRLNSLDWKSDSYYDAMQVQIKKRMGHGFQVQGSYTWAKSIDTGSATLAGDPFANSISSLAPFDSKLNRGPSDFNVGQNLVINYTWEIPGPKFSPISEWLLGGWEFGGIFEASSGVPFTMSIGGDPLGLNSQDPWDFPDRIAGPGCKNPINPGHPDNYVKLECFAFPFPSVRRGNEGRNSLTGPGLMNFDMSLVKNSYVKRISESFNVQFRMEVFNIFNRPNFAPPLNNSVLYDGTVNADGTGNIVGGAGLLDSTLTPSRQIQFGLKIIW